MIPPAKGHKQRTIARSLGLLALASVAGCAISFDGYQLESDTDASVAADAGTGPATDESATADSGAIPDTSITTDTSTPIEGAVVDGNDGSPINDGAAPFDADAQPAQGDAGAAPAPCPAAGTPMIAIPIPTGAPGYPGVYCVDQTEVTNIQYADFLATHPSTAGQPGVCAWNTSYQPQQVAGTENCENVALVFDPANHPQNPVACIDWCDAYAYCKSVGKRLCGAFGGGTVPQGEGANVKLDQWSNACSASGTKAYPYGAAYDGQRCNTLEYGQTGSIAVTPHDSCEGGDLGIYDMSGNVAEWEDACNTANGASDSCLVRGGYFNSSDSPSNSAACGATPATIRSRISRQIGFRCCFDGK